MTKNADGSDRLLNRATHFSAVLLLLCIPFRATVDNRGGRLALVVLLLACMLARRHEWGACLPDSRALRVAGLVWLLSTFMWALFGPTPRREFANSAPRCVVTDSWFLRFLRVDQDTYRLDALGAFGVCSTNTRCNTCGTRSISTKRDHTSTGLYRCRRVVGLVGHCCGIAAALVVGTAPLAHQVPAACGRHGN